MDLLGAIFSVACYQSIWQPKEATMRWYHYISYFFGGVFLANALPHLGTGISGHAFQSPLATPPGVGLWLLRSRRFRE